MTQVAVELCGRLADLAGDTVTADVTLPASIAAIRVALADVYPSLAIELASDRIRACLDDTIVGNDAIVRPGQMLALFPPVSGG